MDEGTDARIQGLRRDTMTNWHNNLAHISTMMKEFNLSNVPENTSRQRQSKKLRSTTAADEFRVRVEGLGFRFRTLRVEKNTTIRDWDEPH